VNQRPVEGDDQRGRIDRYLRDSGMASRSPIVVPLTGDASDRRYFRIHLSDGDSVVLALHAGPIDFSTLPFANVWSRSSDNCRSTAAWGSISSVSSYLPSLTAKSFSRSRP